MKLKIDDVIARAVEAELSKVLPVQSGEPESRSLMEILNDSVVITGMSGNVRGAIAAIQVFVECYLGDFNLEFPLDSDGVKTDISAFVRVINEGRGIYKDAIQAVVNLYDGGWDKKQLVGRIAFNFSWRERILASRLTSLASNDFVEFQSPVS